MTLKFKLDMQYSHLQQGVTVPQIPLSFLPSLDLDADCIHHCIA